MPELRQESSFTELVAQVKPSGFLDCREFLRTLYLHLKDHFGKYSYLQFAEDLGFSATNVLHHVIQGRRPLTLKAATQIAKALDLKGLEAKYFKALVGYANAKTPTGRDQLFKALYELKDETTHAPDERAALEYYSEWYHPVIGELTRLETFISDPKWISANLIPDVKPAQVSRSLALLERLGLVVYDKKRGRHIRTEKDLSTGHETRGLVVAQYHYAMIQHGREAIAQVDQDERDISGLTLCLSAETAKNLKTMIHEFQRQILAEEARSPRKEQIYQVNIQLFPFTKIKTS